MKVYIVEQTWETPYDSKDSSIIGVYDSYEKAYDKVKELYEEDIDWLLEHCDREDIEESDINDSGSFVQYDEWWSNNTIYKKEVQ